MTANKYAINAKIIIGEEKNNFILLKLKLLCPDKKIMPLNKVDKIRKPTKDTKNCKKAAFRTYIILLENKLFNTNRTVFQTGKV